MKELTEFPNRSSPRPENLTELGSRNRTLRNRVQPASGSPSTRFPLSNAEKWRSHKEPHKNTANLTRSHAVENIKQRSSRRFNSELFIASLAASFQVCSRTNIQLVRHMQCLSGLLALSHFHLCACASTSLYQYLRNTNAPTDSKPNTTCFAKFDASCALQILAI